MDTLLHIGLSNALVATGLAVLAGWARVCRCRPALVHGLCVLVLVKLLTPALVWVPIDWSSPPEVAAAPAIGAKPAAEELVIVDWLPLEVPVLAAPAVVAAAPPPPMAVPWAMIVGGIWLAGSFICLVLAGVRIRRFTCLLRQANPATAALQQTVDTLAQRLGLSRTLSTWLVPGTLSPMMWAWGRPRLLIPADLWQRLDDDQRATLLVHELAHLLRRDHWVRCLELTATVLYWWHPALWWTRGRLHDAEEQCCDAWVVWALPAAGRAYAQALLETIDFLAGARRALPLASAAGQFPVLKRRLTMILQGTTPRRLSVAGLIVILGLGLALPLAPAWVQAQGEDVRERKPAPPDKNEKEIEDLTREMERLHGELAKVHKRLLELGGEKRIMMMRHMPLATPGVRVPPPMPADVVVFRAGTGDEEVLKAQLAVKQAQLRESEILLQGAKDQVELVQRLARQGLIGADEVREALQNVQMRAAQLEAKQAELQEAEARIRGARFHMEVKPFPPPPVKAVEVEIKHPKPAPTADRMQELEKKLDILMRELESLRKEIKR